MSDRALFFGLLLLALLAVTLNPLYGQLPPLVESPTLAAVADGMSRGDVEAANRFWATLHHTPLIEAIPNDERHVLATFLWRGGEDIKDVVLVAQPDGIAPGRDERSHLVHLAGSDIWYRTHKLPVGAEFSYLFSINPPGDAGSRSATLRADPLNPLQYRILTGPLRSIARMPGVESNPWIGDDDVLESELHQHRIKSSTLEVASERQLWIYTTPGELRNPNVLLVLDRAVYTTAVPTPMILHHLNAQHLIGPTIAVFVGEGTNDTWQTDMYFSDAFVEFLADEVLPYVRHEYGLEADRSKTVVVGESIEGLTAAFAALRRPDAFGAVISQSGSFWLNNRDLDNGEPEWLTRQILKTPSTDVRFYLDVGQMEFVANEADRMFPPFVPGTTSLLASNRHLRDVLLAKGYRVDYVEVYAGHEPLHWRRTLPGALMRTLR
jgi:enterochelin esterase-like enzyme